MLLLKVCARSETEPRTEEQEVLSFLVRLFERQRIYFRIKVYKMKSYILLVVSIYLSKCSALYFHMGETEKKCFLEEIPDETMVTGKRLGPSS